jgi:hypothetical protein
MLGAHIHQAIAKTDPRGDTVNSYDQDSLRLLTRERLEQRVREADAERLARKISGKARKRRRLPLARMAAQRVGQPRLEA